MKKKKGMTREEIIDAKVYKGVLGLYGLPPVRFPY